MNTKTFSNIADAVLLVNQLEEDNKHAVSVSMTNNQVVVSWIENKKYITHDNAEYIDEVWVTINGDMIACQDLTPEHARNIVRMTIRQSRKQLAKMLEDIGNSLSTIDELEDQFEPDQTDQIDPDNRVLH